MAAKREADGAGRGDPAEARQRPGADADTPRQIPAAGWRQIAVRAWQQASSDNISILAGGVAFAGFLAIFPALIAALTIYGLVADPARARQQIADFASALPQSTQDLVTDQLSAVATGSGGALTAGLVISVLAALFSASGGVASLMTAVNLAYDENEERGFLELRGMALVLTLGAVVFTLITLALVAVLPAALDNLGLPAVADVFVQIGRWVLLVCLVIGALAILYRVAPDRQAPRFRWVSAGSLAAGLLWVLGSIVFSLYVNFFGDYNATYGALAGVIVLMLWFYLTAYIVLLGAEINAESEKQTRR